MESDTRSILSSIARLEEKVDGINKRLDVQNGKVARNTENIQELKIVDTQVLDKLGVILGDFNDWKIDHKKWSWFWIERIAWFLVAIIMAALISTGVIHL